MRLGLTIEEFARQHRLPAHWLKLREACNRLVARPDFWYRTDLRNEAQQLAGEASHILQAALRKENRCAGPDSRIHKIAESVRHDCSLVARR